MKYLLTNIRNASHLVRSICSSPQSIRRIPLKSNRSIKRAVSSNMKHKNGLGLQMYHLYSTSSRETFKAEAPIGVYQNSRTTFRMHLLGLRLGESFNRLSRHINLYFKQKQVSVIDYGQNELISAVQEPLTRSQRRVQRERRSGESRYFIGTPSIEQAHQTSSNQHLTLAYPGPQLFHISSLANRFGETYSYVANHINSVFSRNPAKQIHVEVSPDDGFRRLCPCGQRFHCPVHGGSGSFRLGPCAVQFGAWHCCAADVICTSQDTEELNVARDPQVSMRRRSGTLEIFFWGRPDDYEGVYQCTATNEFGSALSSHIHLRVSSKLG